MKNGFQKAEYLKRHRIFAHMGENCFWQPINIPPEAKLIKLHNNVVVASEVLFITHDVIHHVFRNINPEGNYCLNLGPIEVGDNVFIGSRSIILPNVKIGSNVIIGAGSLVASDIPDGLIVGGVPVRKIGSFDELLDARKNKVIEKRKKVERFQDEWEKFYMQRSEKQEVSCSSE